MNHRCPTPGAALFLALLAAACAAPDERWTQAELFARHDRDGDGRILPHEHGRGEAAFRNLDRDGDGAVTAADLEQPFGMPPDLAVPMLLVRWLGGPGVEVITPDEAAAGFAAADADGDGRLTRAEFEALAASGDAAPGPDRFATLLAGVDADGDGALSAAEVARQFETRDRDGDGRLHRQEGLIPARPLRTGAIPLAEREPAPAIDLPDPAGDERITLDSLRGRPVVLIFGSFT